MVEWSDWIRANRKHKMMTVEQLAEEIGSSPRSVANWEAGSPVSRKYQERINQLFGEMPK